MQTTAGLQLTAIDNAATRGHPKTVALLAELGADIHCKGAPTGARLCTPRRPLVTPSA